MQDRALGEPHLLGEDRIRVERVDVAREAVEEGLLRRVVFSSTRKSGSLVFLDLGHLRLLRRRLTAPVALAAEDDARRGLGDELALLAAWSPCRRRRSRSCRMSYMARIVAVVDTVPEAANGLWRLHALTAVHHHREIAARLRHELEHRLEHGDDGEAREHLRAVPLVEVVELVALGADPERVEHGVLPCVRERGGDLRTCQRG
jgi:hypothetical protein